MLQLRRLVLLAAVAIATAHAATRVTLRNGFSYDCAGEQALDAAHTRLFLSTGNDTSYVDIPSADILTQEPLPAPPVPQPSAPSASPDLSVYLHTAGNTHNIDVELLASIVHAESGGRARALSHTGAQGLMQLMPSTARQLGVKDSYAPEDNINGGTAYLDALLHRYHDNLALTLAAYNAGPGAVDHFHGIPPYRETRAYVVRVMTEFKHRKQILITKAAR